MFKSKRKKRFDVCYGCGESTFLSGWVYLGDAFGTATVLGLDPDVRGLPETGRPLHTKCARTFRLAKLLYDPTSEETTDVYPLGPSDREFIERRRSNYRELLQRAGPDSQTSSL